MRKYQFTPETIPDPVVGRGFYMFPVIQYRGGKAKVIWPPEWKEIELQTPGP
jgi:branched-chain amino acid transport system substrate-binding protein